MGQSAETRPELAAFNASCREAAKKKGIILVDYSVEFNKIYDAGGEEALKPYQRDGILPTRKAAQEILVPMLWDAILGRCLLYTSLAGVLVRRSEKQAVTERITGGCPVLMQK